MQIALDRNKARVSAEDATKGDEYCCPLCSKLVTLCKGDIKIPYFSHWKNDLCNDTWKYDTSEWHLMMQSRFPKEQREVVVTHGGKTHRADILCGNQVIEFQHSEISSSEIQERNSFYNAAGYNVAWVFDLQEAYDAGRITDSGRENALGYRWTYAKPSLQVLPVPKEYKKDIVVHFYWIDEYGAECFNKVIWARNDGKTPDFRDFIVANYRVYTESVDDALNIGAFFQTKRDQLYSHLRRLGRGWNVKYSGPKGHKRDEYVCPKTGNFGLRPYGEHSCRYCKHCGAIFSLQQGFEAYCCYPSVVNDEEGAHPGYECSGAAEF